MSTTRVRFARAGLAGTAIALTALVALTGCSSSGGGSSSLFGGSAQPTAGAKAATGSSGSSTKSGSGSSSKTVDLTKLDPCTLFTKDEAEKLVGATLSDAQDAKGQTQPSCTYNPDPNGPTAKTALDVGEGALSFYTIDKNQGHAFTDVPGLGDEAHLERQAIFWKSGSTWLGISMLRLVDDDHEFDQALTDTAKEVQAAFIAQ